MQAAFHLGGATTGEDLLLQLELLRAHPPLGTRLALSGYSQTEQAGAGLGRALCWTPLVGGKPQDARVPA